MVPNFYKSLLYGIFDPFLSKICGKYEEIHGKNYFLSPKSLFSGGGWVNKFGSIVSNLPCFFFVFFGGGAFCFAELGVPLL